MAEQKKVRLPTSVVPVLYRLELKALTDLDSFTFEGKVSIDADVTAEAVKSISVHALDLKIDAKDVKYKSGKEDLQASSCSFDKHLETVTFNFSSALPQGRGCLEIGKYIGDLNDKMKGFYRSKYKVDGKERYMAVTQFEATDARRCLPCWDEPAVKAEFEATLVVPKGETAISNMPVTSGYPAASKTSGDLVVWKFDRTPRMSTYLLAFVVGQFDYIEATSKAGKYYDGKTSGDVAVRVYAPKGKTCQGEFALDVAVKSLEYFTKFFQIGYPLPKLDLIAIPDFSSGAMENWGCVTYRTVCLLVDSANTALKNKQYVAIVVAHELAHQWFGNLVTMEWWTELWLNEGFASWVEYLAVDKLFPEWKVWQSFINEAHNPALGLDALLTSHPIEVPVNHPSEIDEIFDTISYLKGASVIRMLANHLGLETFRQGLVKYLDAFKLRNARTTDLWKMLEVGGGLDEGAVSSLMTNWTGKMGYPVVSVEEVEGGFAVTQQHFVASGDKGEGTIWHVPLNIGLISDGKMTTKKHLLTEQKALIAVGGGYSSAVLNHDSQAYTIVKYGPKLFSKLVEAIKAGDIKNPVDRLAIQQDLMAVVKAGIDKDVTSKSYFDLLKSYKSEIEYIVWESMLSKLNSLSVLAKAAGFKKAFSGYMVELLAGIATQVGWEKKEGEPATTQMLRAQVIPLIGAHGHPPTVKTALARFDAFYKNGEYKEGFKGTATLPPDFRLGVYRIAVKTEGKRVYEQLMDIYKATSLQEERVRVLRSLGAVKDEKLLQATLDLSLDFGQVRKQDFMYPIFGAVGTDKGLRMTWAFLRKHWKHICKEFEGTSMLVRLVSITGRFAKSKDYDDVADFFNKNEHKGAERKVKQCLETIKTNAAWLKRDQAAIAKAVGATMSNM